MATLSGSLSQLCFEIPQAAKILRISRATLYQRIRGGSIAVQHDGRRTFITAIEIHRYVTPIRQKSALNNDDHGKSVQPNGDVSGAAIDARAVVFSIDDAGQFRFRCNTNRVSADAETVRHTRRRIGVTVGGNVNWDFSRTRGLGR